MTNIKEAILEKEVRATLWLQYVVALPATHIVSLWRQFGSIVEALRADDRTLGNIIPEKYLTPLLRKRPRFNAWRALPQEAVTEDVVLLPLASPDYPELLKDIHTPPPLLYVRGDVQLLSVPQIAIVGTRHPTAAGANTARSFACELTKIGFAVTSGLAYGIDAMAHRGALDGGATVAVLGTGIDPIYPARHHKLAREILDAGGALVSEMPANTPALPAYFPQRNRIISGLSLGVLVVEAAPKSGSLITARQALEQGREVFAVPGSIHNEVSRGCHQLLRDGATLVEKLDDITDQLGAMVEYKREELRLQGQPLSDSLNANERHLLDAVGFEMVDFDALVNRTGLSTPELTVTLLELELKGLLAQESGGYQRVR